MIARVDDVPASERHTCRSAAKAGSWRTVAGPAVLLTSLVFYFASTNNRSTPSADLAAVLEYIRADFPHQGLLDEPQWMLVEVFDPTTATWDQRRKDHVKPGQEFRAMNLLFKQVMMDGLSEIHGEVDVNSMEQAYAAFDVDNVRNPTPDDVVYVLGEQLPKGGFHTLCHVGPSQTFRFQGRVFTTKRGSRPDTVCVVDTGKTFAKAGGDPEAKPPLMIRTAYTDKFFPDPKLPKADSTGGDQQ